MGLDHVPHLLENGSYFHHPEVLKALGFKQAERWEAVNEAGEKP